MDISLALIKRPLVNFLHRFHVIIFVVVVLGSLAASVFFLYGIIVSSGESNGYSSTSNNASFDQATIHKIEQLKTQDETGGALTLPPGRTNPFVE